MTDIKEHMNDVSTWMRRFKETWVKVAGAMEKAPRDLEIYCQVYRDDKLQAIVQGKDKEPASVALGVLAEGIEADRISFTFEGWRPNKEYQDLNPDTGKPWAPNEMQNYFDLHGKGDVLNEDLVSLMVDREGNTAWCSQPFHYEGDQLVWDVDEIFLCEEEPTVNGAIVEVMKMIMDHPKLGDRLHKEVPAVIEEIERIVGVSKRLFFQKVAAVRKVEEELKLPVHVMLLAASEEENKWLGELGYFLDTGTGGWMLKKG